VELVHKRKKEEKKKGVGGGEREKAQDQEWHSPCMQGKSCRLYQSGIVVVDLFYIVLFSIFI